MFQNEVCWGYIFLYLYWIWLNNDCCIQNGNFITHSAITFSFILEKYWKCILRNSHLRKAQYFSSLYSICNIHDIQPRRVIWRYHMITLLRCLVIILFFCHDFRFAIETWDIKFPISIRSWNSNLQTIQLAKKS